jgi:hypothetical protein
MNIETPSTPRPTPTRRRLRAPVIALLAVVSFAGACAPPTPPVGGGGVDIPFGPITIPLPPIEVRPAATNIPVLGVCNVSYRPPGIQIVGATVMIPGIRIDPNNPIVTVPNVVVKIPQMRVPVSTVTLSCGPLVQVSVTPVVIIPSTVVVKAATLNLNARTITLTDPTFTINGAGLELLGLGIIVPLPPIVNIPLPTTAISF